MSVEPNDNHLHTGVGGVCSVLWGVVCWADDNCLCIALGGVCGVPCGVL